MASIGGGTSTGSSSLHRQSSSSSEREEIPPLIIDERKRKRMESNRESARRSRMKKQKHLDDLMTQVANLKKENSEILSSMNLTTQLYLKIEADNSVLRAQMDELRNRLGSLNEIIGVMSGNGGAGVSCGIGVFVDEESAGGGVKNQFFGDTGFMNMNNWSPMYLNQPIMASAADIFLH